jgi:hypothetical protein
MDADLSVSADLGLVALSAPRSHPPPARPPAAVSCDTRPPPVGPARSDPERTVFHFDCRALLLAQGGCRIQCFGSSDRGRKRRQGWPAPRAMQLRPGRRRRARLRRRRRPGSPARQTTRGRPGGGGGAAGGRAAPASRSRRRPRGPRTRRGRGARSGRRGGWWPG